MHCYLTTTSAMATGVTAELKFVRSVTAFVGPTHSNSYNPIIAYVYLVSAWIF